MTATFEDRDPSVRPADDLFRHVNGTWISQAVIPDDRSGDGPFYQLDDESREAVHRILEDLSSGKGEDIRDKATAHEVEVAVELYRRYMDVDVVEKAGAEPLRPFFEEIDGISSVVDLVTFLGKAERRGITGLFDVADESDPGDPTREVLWIGQGGIGLCVTSRLPSSWPAFLTASRLPAPSWTWRPKSLPTTGIECAAATCKHPTTRPPSPTSTRPTQVCTWRSGAATPTSR